MNVGLIGCGAIGSLVYDVLSRDAPGVNVNAVYERLESHEAARKALGADVRIVGCIKDFLNSEHPSRSRGKERTPAGSGLQRPEGMGGGLPRSLCAALLLFDQFLDAHHAARRRCQELK